MNRDEIERLIQWHAEDAVTWEAAGATGAAKASRDTAAALRELLEEVERLRGRCKALQKLHEDLSAKQANQSMRGVFGNIPPGGYDYD